MSTAIGVGIGAEKITPILLVNRVDSICIKQKCVEKKCVVVALFFAVKRLFLRQILEKTLCSKQTIILTAM
jgi:hypothetical protein